MSTFCTAVYRSVSDICMKIICPEQSKKEVRDIGNAVYNHWSINRTKETLKMGNYLSVINILMQLRKVCNHPNLFEERPVLSPLVCHPLMVVLPSLAFDALREVPSEVSVPGTVTYFVEASLGGN